MLKPVISALTEIQEHLATTGDVPINKYEAWASAIDGAIQLMAKVQDLPNMVQSIAQDFDVSDIEPGEL